MLSISLFFKAIYNFSIYLRIFFKLSVVETKVYFTGIFGLQELIICCFALSKVVCVCACVERERERERVHLPSHILTPKERNSYLEVESIVFLDYDLLT